MPEIQLKAGQELVESLKKRYDIKKVLRHCDVNNTSCPGVNFPYDRMVEKLENLILSFQRAALADGVKLPKYGADGYYGSETETAMKKCIVKRRMFYKYKNCTRLVQRLLNITADGLCGPATEQAIKRYQTKKGLNPDGCVGLATWSKLLGIN
jgi:peptidoglycan hydrolase-like protein with peptidoglycan-binding domain